MKRTGLVVTGTDTGVGKTCVAAALVRALSRRGFDVAPWKPYATGVDPDRLARGEDADLLLRAAGWSHERLSDVSPARLRDPLAPDEAARAAGVSLDPDHVLRRVPPAEFLVVEGCGGLLVPIAPGYDVRELCWDLDLPILIVARPALGTLNHTALTVEAARSAGLHVLGVVFSGSGPADDPSVAGNASAVARHSDVPFLGHLPHVQDAGDVDALADALEEALDVEALHARVRASCGPERGRRLADADLTCVWHPFTQMRDWERETPVVIERAKGAWLFDTEGRRYLDGVSSLWVTTHGHREPEIDAAVRRQLGRLAHSTLLGLANDASIECAQRLTDLAPPGLTRVFFSDSGSTAVEVALKMSFQSMAQTGRGARRLFVHFDGSYHGDTIGSVSVGGMQVFHDVFGPLLFGALRVTAPARFGEHASLAEFESVMAERGHEVAAVIVEPVMQGAVGMVPQPAGWLPRVAEITRDAGAHLICDEVATGFGRTGRMFAVEHEDVRPDFLCVAKGLTGGYLPLAATLTTDAVYDAFLGEPHELRTFFHGHTYTGNPLACAAAIANLDLMRRRGTVAEAARKGELLGGALERLVAPHPHVGAVRRRGLMAGIELVADRATNAPLPAQLRAGWHVCRAAQDLGLRIRPLGDVVVLMPPLGTPDDLLLRMAEITRDALAAVPFKELST